MAKGKSGSKSPSGANAKIVNPQQLGIKLPEENNSSYTTCMATFYGLVALSVLLTGGGLLYCVTSVIQAISVTPMNWLTIVIMGTVTGLLAVFFRVLLWISFLVPTVIAGNSRCFKAQDKLCNWAIKARPLLSGGATWATQSLMQVQLARGEVQNAIDLGTIEYEQVIKKKPNDQTLAPICSQIALAEQMKGDFHASITWNERALEMYKKSLDSVLNDKSKKKGLAAKAGVLDNAILQLAAVQCNLATSYFNVRNFGKAKSNFNQALENAYKVKDSPEKESLIKASKDALSRLKHW